MKITAPVNDILRHHAIRFPERVADRLLPPTTDNAPIDELKYFELGSRTQSVTNPVRANSGVVTTSHVIWQ